MRILVTGLYGFTGRNFLKLAQQNGHETIFMISDLRNKEAVFREITNLDFDNVLHLAAISFLGHENASAFYEVNTVGTINFLDSLVQAEKKINCVVLASSANVYGNCESSPISEDQVPNPVNHYAMSKLAMEVMAQNYFKYLPIVIARPFNYTGIGQSLSFLIPKLIKACQNKSESIDLGNTDVYREFNDVEIICEFYIHLLKFGKISETYNLCTGDAYSINTIIDKLSKISGHSLRIKVANDLVRKNEIHKLWGNAAKLKESFNTHGQLFPESNLDFLLKKMLVTDLT